MTVYENQTGVAVATRTSQVKPESNKTKQKSKNTKNKQRNKQKEKAEPKHLALVGFPPSRAVASVPKKSNRKNIQRRFNVKPAAFVRKILAPSSAPAQKTSVFDLRDRVQRRNLAVRVMQIFGRAVRARAEARKILSGAYTRGEADKHGIRLMSVETEPLSNEHIAEGAAHELEQREILPRREKKHMVTNIEDEMVHDELESNAVGHMYFDSLLNPCSAPNPGVPDAENRALSMKLRVRTTYLLPMTNNEAYVIVSRNPLNHIQIQDVSGASTFTGPTLECRTAYTATGNQEFYDESGKTIVKTPTFAAVNQATQVDVSAGYNRTGVNDEFYNPEGETLDLVSTPYVENSELHVAKCLPCAAGDTVRVVGWTSDTHPGNYETFAIFVTKNGAADAVLNTVNSGLLTGTGLTGVYSLSGTVTAPADTIALKAYGIRNMGTAGTTTIPPKLRCNLNLAAAPVTYPIGASDLSDINLLINEADDVRVVGCRATLTYVAKKLEGGYVVGGQLPQAGDDVIPYGDLSSLAVIPGMKPRPLNGVTSGISFPIFALSKDENDYLPITSLADNDQFAEGAIQVVTTGADADLLILQTEMSLQARTERQVLMATTGEVDLKAISDVQTFIARKGPLSFVTANDEHEEVSQKMMEEYSRSHPTFSFFNGWFSGNTTTVSDVTVV